MIETQPKHGERMPNPAGPGAGTPRPARVDLAGGPPRARPSQEGKPMADLYRGPRANPRTFVADTRLTRLGAALRLLALPADRGRFDDLLEQLAQMPGTAFPDRTAP